MTKKTEKYSGNLFAFSRRRTVEVMVGQVGIGGNNPVRIQTMVTTPTQDIDATVGECMKMADVGAELVRITAPGVKDAEALGVIRQRLRAQGYNIPLIADIHFNPDVAVVAARNVEKIRINPGNFTDKQAMLQPGISDFEESWENDLSRLRAKFVSLLDVCKEYGTALRIGANHGSLSGRIMSRYGDTPAGMVESAMEFLRICKEESFDNVVVSMKASNTRVMVRAYRLLVAAMNAEEMYYPLHLGVTEAGDGEDGRIKSAVGIGALLADGLGDTIRVSLTEAPENEIPVARELVKYFTYSLTTTFVHEVHELYELHERSNLLGKEVVVIADLSKLNPLYEMDTSPLTPPHKGGECPRKEEKCSQIDDEKGRVEYPRKGEKYCETDEAEMEKYPRKEEKCSQIDGDGVVEYPRKGEKYCETDGEEGRVEYPRKGEKYSEIDEAEMEKYPRKGDKYSQIDDEKGMEKYPRKGKEGRGESSQTDKVENGVECSPPLWEEGRGEVFPDYIYTGSSTVAFDSENLKIIDDNNDNFIFCNYALLTNSFLEWLRENQDKILVVSSENVNCIAELRAFFLKLEHHKIVNPVVIARSYAETDFEKLQIRAACDFGGLLIDGFGAGVMLSAAAEIPAKLVSDLCFRILQAARVRYTRTEYIACPGCGRTLFDLQDTLKRVKEATAGFKNLKIGVMGCIVNGPGEMADADYGYVGAGVGKVTLYKGMTPAKKNIPQENAIKELIELIKENEL
jgi:(E)-4-hydroxy-3-methylbut-2-enyl-diphosphate synthase